ncbi:GNAT family N-acetyltransferase [Bacillus salitolerans]|uniref:GNAT family N-acetyltransferase n=1 Tax=Bacillus salitolerans TaxID=1437434 RepID=A0ABW4LWA3_9BACI
MSNYPILETDRLILRKIREEDADFLLEHFGNPEVVRYFGMSPMKERESAIGFIDSFKDGFENNTVMRWAITDKETGKTMGTVGFHNISNSYRRCEVGYDLSPAFWGKGIMPEALAIVIDFLFENRQMNRVGATIVNHNAASSRVVEKLGFKNEGLLRHYIIQEGELLDAYMFSILKEEWDQR